MRLRWVRLGCDDSQPSPYKSHVVALDQRNRYATPDHHMDHQARG